MRIRSKIFSLVLSAMAFLSISAVVYFASQSVNSKIEAERRVLLSLGDSVKDLNIAVNLLDTGQIDSSEARFVEKRATAMKYFEAVDGLRYIPRINDSLKESIEIIRNLSALAADDLESLASAYAALREDAQKYFMSSRETTLRQFYTDEYARKKYDLSAVYKRLEDFSTLSFALTDTLLMSSDVITEKNLLIDKGIAEASARSLLVCLLVAASLVAVALLMAFYLSRNLAKPIISIESSIASLSTGDLSERVLVSSKDELGALGRELNVFLDSLSSSISSIQTVSRENDELKRSLVEALTRASSSTVEIDANATSIKRQVEGLDARITGARETLVDMSRGIIDYAGRVSEQDGMIVGSSASMDEVIVSIDSISRIADADRVAAESLLHATEESRVVFSETFGSLSEIAKSVEDINGMARVISEISSRTNLLAMNAAIEAAHAGESGKGFAVVADEIRKLASAAASSSKKIGETIRSVSAKMTRAEGEREKAASSFETMDAHIVSVTTSSAKIDELLVAIRGKADAVLASMSALREASAATAKGSSGIKEAAVSVDGAVSEASRVSQEVKSNIAEIVAGLGEISSSVREVLSLADTLGEASARLDSAVNAFRL